MLQLLLPQGSAGAWHPTKTSADVPVPTQAVHAESRVIEEVADVPGAGGHGAEGVGAAGGEGIDAAGQQVGEEGPGVGVLPAPRPP